MTALALRPSNEKPNAAEVALDFLKPLIDDFEFETPLDRSVALAALVTALVRPRLRTAPMFVVGARRLAEIAAALAGGSTTLIVSSSPPLADVAIRVALNAHPPVLLLDANWTGHPLGGSALVTALSTSDLLARVPGTTRVAPVRATVFAIGPEIRINKEIAGHVLTCRVTDPGFDPVARAARYRDDHRAAAEALIEAGDDWKTAVRDPLVALGLPDPADALGALPVETPRR
jgi:putative DNA primase/helicase